MQRIITSVLCACAILSVSSASGAAKGSLTLSTGLKVEGVVSWSAREKKYSVTKDNIATQYALQDVDEIDIEQPASYANAVALVEKGQGATGCRQAR